MILGGNSFDIGIYLSLPVKISDKLLQVLEIGIDYRPSNYHGLRPEEDDNVQNNTETTKPDTIILR